MNPSFERLMAEATSLTRSGMLEEATAAIQAALAGKVPTEQAAAASRDTCVIDVEAREIRNDPVIVEAPCATPSTGEFIAGSHAEAALTRDYKLYIPPGPHTQPLPLVVMLHGCTQNPDDFALGTGMNDAALERGFFVLYPAQARKANTSRCWNWFKHNHQRRGSGEPALLAGMTRAVMQRHAIDPQRVYVAGLSAGGAMAAILGDAYPDLYAAVGVHSGLPPGSATDVASAFGAMKSGAPATGRPRAVATPPPTIVLHGDQDATVHPANGEQLVAACAAAGTPERLRARSAGGREYTRRCYRGADGRVLAEHWAVHGAGHAWSGGNPKGSYTDVQGPSATEAMLDFFFMFKLHP